MSDLHRFQYGALEIRMQSMAGEPWFCLKDVGAVLGFERPSNFLRSPTCDEEGVMKLITPSSSGPQEMNFISEANLYALIMRSTKDEAIAFQRWVTKEVLPSIRRSGSYSAPVAKVDDPLLASLEVVASVRREQLAMADQVRDLTDRLEKIEARRPLVLPSAETGKTRVKMLVAHVAYVSGVAQKDVYHEAYGRLESEAGIELVARKRKWRARSLLDVVEAEQLLDRLVRILEDMAQGVRVEGGE